MVRTNWPVGVLLALSLVNTVLSGPIVGMAVALAGIPIWSAQVTVGVVAASVVGGTTVAVGAAVGGGIGAGQVC